MVALLLGLGLLSAHHPTSPLLLCGVITFAAFYLTGTVWERRHALGMTQHNPLPYARAWCAGIALLWVGLVVLSESFSWLLFPLVFLFLHVFGWVLGLMCIALGWAIVVLLAQPLTVGAVVGPGVGVLTAVVAFWVYRALLHETEMLRHTRGELAEAEKRAGRLEERERLSREIHDTLAQGFSSIVLLSRAARRTDDPTEQLRTIEDVAQYNLDEARSLVVSLSREPLGQTLAALVHRARGQAQALGTDTDVELTIDGDPSALPDSLADVLYRTAQEGITNALRHAKASRIKVSLAMWEDRVALDICDDGVGGATLGRGFGLTGIERRLREFDGELTVSSSAHAGTTLSAHLPLRAREHSDHQETQ